MSKHLFRLGNYQLHSGSRTGFLIDCDALSDEDWRSLAQVTDRMFGPFGRVEGVPNGGLRFAAALAALVTPGHRRLLIVDDVLTTGASMEAQRNGREAVGVVVFARGKAPEWVTALFRTTIRLEALT